MKRAFSVLHMIITTTAIVICLNELWRSFNFFGLEHFAITYQRSSVAILLGAYAGAQFLFQMQKKLKLATAIAFYPLGILLVLVTAFVTRASGKSWAPATQEEAMQANIFWYGILILLISACVASFMFKSRIKKKNA